MFRLLSGKHPTLLQRTVFSQTLRETALGQMDDPIVKIIFCCLEVLMRREEKMQNIAYFMRISLLISAVVRLLRGSPFAYCSPPVSQQILMRNRGKWCNETQGNPRTIPGAGHSGGTQDEASLSAFAI